MLRDVEEMSTTEAADVIEITEENVKVRLHRARALLRNSLYARAGMERKEVFNFHAARCDPVVENVFERIQKHDRKRTTPRRGCSDGLQSAGMTGCRNTKSRHSPKGEEVSMATKEISMAGYGSKLLSRVEVADGTMAFHFEKPSRFDFKPGQAADVTLSNTPETDSEGNTRTF